MSFTSDYLRLRQQQLGNLPIPAGSSAAAPAAPEEKTSEDQDSYTSEYLKLRKQRMGDRPFQAGNSTASTASERADTGSTDSYTREYLALRDNMTIQEKVDARVEALRGGRIPKPLTLDNAIKSTVALPTGPKTSGGFYSRPDFAAQGEKLYSFMGSTESGLTEKTQQVQSAQEALMTAQKGLEAAEAQLNQAMSAYNAAPTAANAVAYNRMAQAYEEQRQGYQSAYESYTQAYGAYKAAEEDVVTALTAQRVFQMDQQDAVDRWRNTIRDQGEIQKEIADTDRKIQEQKARDKAAAEAAQKEAAERYAAQQAEKPWYEKLGEYLGGVQDTSLPLAGVTPEMVDDAFAEKPATKEMQALLDKKALLEEEMNWSRYYYYDDYTKAPDFAEKSKYVPQERKQQSNMDILMGNYSSEASGWEDPLYEAINGNEEAKAYLSNAGANGYGSENFLGALFGRAADSKAEAQKMEEYEVKIFNYLYATQGKEKAHEYYDSLQGDLKYRQRKAEQEVWAKYAAKDPVGSSVFSVAMALAKGLGYAGQAGDYLGTGKIDKNAAYNKFSYVPGAIRGEIVRGMEEKGNWGKVGSFAYQTGLSMADFLITTALAGGNEPLALGIMGSGAAADSTLAAKDRGLTDGQAFWLGTVAGMAEVVTEKVSLETLLNPDMLKNGSIQYVLKNMLAEGSEEVGSDLINLFADVLISKDQSQWQESVDAYIKQGYTREEAMGMAVADQAMQMGGDFLGGAISGGILSGINAGIQGRYTGKLGQELEGMHMSQEDIQLFIETGLDSDPDSTAYSLAQELQKKLQKGKPLTKNDLSRIYQANILEHQEMGWEQERESQDTDRGQEAQAEAQGTEPTGVSPSGMGQDIQSQNIPQNLTQSLTQDPAQAIQEENRNAGERNYINEIGGNQNADTQNGIGENPNADAGNGIRGIEIATAPAGSPGTGAGIPDGGIQRSAGTGAQEQAGGLAGGPGAQEKAARAQQIRAEIRRQNYLRSLRLPKVSSLELGLQDGTEERRNAVVPQESWDEDMRRTADRIWEETGKNITFVTGKMQIRIPGKGIGYIRGIFTGDQIIVQADNTNATFDQLADHEAYHAKAAQAAEEGQNLNDKLQECVISRFSPEEFDKAMVKYMDGVGDIVGLEEGQGGEEYEAALQRVKEELLADAYAGINAFGADTARFIEAVNEGMNEFGYGKLRNQENGTRQTNGPPEGDRYSIETLPDGKKYVRADRQVIFGNDPESWSEQVEDYINGKIRRGKDVQLIAEDGDILTLTATTAGKLADNHTGHGTTLRDEDFFLKSNAAVHIDELAQASARGRTKADKNSRHAEFASKGWNYRTAFFRDFDGKYYQIQISVAQSDNGNVVYNIGRIEERSFPTIYGSSVKDGALGGKTSFGESIPRAGENVKERFSYDGEEEELKGLSLPTLEPEEDAAGYEGDGHVYPGMDDGARAELLQKKEIRIPAYNSKDPVNGAMILRLKNKYASEANKILRTLAKNCGVIDRRYYNADVELDFRYSMNSVRESINKQAVRGGGAEDFGKMLTVLPEVCEGAVEIEAHTDKYAGTKRMDPNIKAVHVLLGAFSDGEAVIPVQLEIKEYKPETKIDNKLYVTVTVKNEAGISSRTDAASWASTNTRNTPASSLSIAEILGGVKDESGDLVKYFPDSMLNDSQMQAKKGAVQKEAARLKDLRYENAVDRGNTVAAEQMLEEKADAQGYTASEDWKARHRAPNSRDGISVCITDLDSAYGGDGSIYSPLAERYYGEGRSYDWKALRILQSVQYDPEAEITVYRAVPKSVKDTRLRNGDWVTQTAEYAREHGESELEGDYRIISQKVPAKHLYANGDSIHELGYDNGNAKEIYKNSPNNVKLKGVTYDDAGNLIPLSQRYDEKNPDIRYSVDDGEEEELKGLSLPTLEPEENTVGYGGKSLVGDSSIYSYDFLTSQPDMNVIQLPDVSEVSGADGRINPGAVVAEGMKNARAVGTVREGNVYVTNRYTGRDVRINVSSIRHGLNGKINRMLTNARLGSVIGDVVRNAIPINALHDTAQGVSGTYAMAGYATDDRGREFVAIVTVEQRDGSVSDISAYDVTHAVSGRQKRSTLADATRASNNGMQADTKSQGVYPIKHSTTVSIADVITAVKDTYQSILSDDVLAHFGEVKNASGHYNTRAKYSYDGEADQEEELKGLSLPTLEPEEENAAHGPEGETQDQGRAEKADYSALEKQYGVESRIRREEWFKEKLGTEGYKQYLEQKAATAKEKKQQAKEKIKPAKPITAKRDLRNTMLNLFSIPDGQRAALGDMIDGYADRIIKNGKLTEEDRKNLFDRLYAAGVMTMPADEYHSVARAMIAEGRIYVSDRVKAEFGDDWAAFRRRAFGAGVYLVNDKSASGIDQWNAELSDESMLPGLFDPEETDQRAILERIIQVAEEGKDEHLSLAEYTAQIAEQEGISEDEFLDDMERRVDQALEVFGKVAGLEVSIRNSAAHKVEQERQKGAQQIARQAQRQARKELAQRKARKEMAQRQRDRKELRELQQKTLKQLQWLSKNRNRAPEELRSTWDEVLSDIDLYAISAADEMHWSEKYQATWKDLAQMYKDAQKNDPNFLPSKELERIVARVDGTKIEDMDLGALQDLYKAAIGLRTEFYNRNNVINDEMQRLFAEVYTDAKREIETAPGGFSGKFMDKLLNLDQLTPMNVLERMGGWDPDGAFYSMAKQLERGERDMRAYTVKANRMLQDFLTEHKEWVKKADGQGKNAVWYEIKVPELWELGMGDKPIFGDTVTVWMTPAQKVHMYLESKNLDNLRHMTGGRTFADKELYSKGKRQEAFAQGRTIRLAPETVKALVSDLTAEEMELAQILDQYYNTFATQEINRVSNILYGYDKAMGKNYAPIYTNNNYTKSEFGVFDVTAEGVGNLKGRQYAVNPSYNISAFDAFERHTDQTARFCGMAIPARNWTTLMNWREKNNSTADVITHKWGEESKKYITDLLTTLQAGDSSKTDTVSAGITKLMSNYITAVFGANPSIVLKQLGSIPLASAYLGAGNRPSISQVHKIDRTLISKYTQDLEWRTMGYSMPETKFLKDNPNWVQSNKFYGFIFGGDAITAMDGWAASTLWPWAENKVRKEHPELEIGTQAQIDGGESPFYKKVAEEFENAVARSQSTSDEIHQSSLRKSKNPLAKAFTMFRSDSAQSYNTIRQKIGEARFAARNGEKGPAYRAAVRAAGAAFMAMVLNAAWSEAVSFLMALWKNKGKHYRDDDDEMGWQSVCGEMTGNMLGSIAGTVIGGEELYEIVGNILTGEKIYDIETPGMEQLNDIIDVFTKAAGGMREIVSGAGNILKNGGNIWEYFGQHKNAMLGSFKEIGEAVATYLPGVPVKNVEAYLLGAVKWLSPELATAYEDLFSDVGKSNLSGLTGSALSQRIGSILDRRNVKTSEDTLDALRALYEAGYKKAVPADIPNRVTIDQAEQLLSPYQKQKYGEIWSSVIGETLEDVVQSDLFERMSKEDREKMLDKLYDYAADLTKAQMFKEYKLPDKTLTAEELKDSGLDLADYIGWLTVTAEMKKQPEKYAELRNWDLDDEAKKAIAGTIMGTEMETESGAPSQYAKMLKALDQGMTMDQYLDLRLRDMDVEDFLEMTGAGVDPERAYAFVTQMEEAGGEEDLSKIDRWRLSVDYFHDVDDQLAALSMVMSESQMVRAEVANDFGVTPEVYVSFYEKIDQYDRDPKGSFTQEEVRKTIDARFRHLTNSQKAALWQIANSSTKSADKNPYSKAVGRRVLEAKAAAKEQE